MWSTDGEFVDKDYTDLVFTNPAIENFLSSNSQFIIVGAQGMGKTLLMRVKRDRIHATNPGLIMIPQQRQLADYVFLGGSYDRGIVNLMATAKFWEHLWIISIQISVLLNFPHKLTTDKSAALCNDLKRLGDALPVDLRDHLGAALTGRYRPFSSPSNILARLLARGRSSIEKLRHSARQTLDALLDVVNSGCFVFIDRFSEALETFSWVDAGMWTAAQHGLLHAAWHISRHNHHVKVYVTIREEAYASFDGDESMGMKSSVLHLSYSKEEMRAIMEKHIAHYEGLPGLEEFIGFHTVFNEYHKCDEDLFDYMHRHLINVPRWLVILGAVLSRARNTATYKNSPANGFRDIVNNVSADLAEEYMVKEARLFFRDMEPREMVHTFFTRTRTTVLSFSNLDYLAKVFTDTFGWKPFSLLYNLGLLGFVQQAATKLDRYQHFKRPSQFEYGTNDILPEDHTGLYLLHPALHVLMRRKNIRSEYCPVLIGDGIPWTSKEDAVMRRETIKIFISYAHADDAVVKEIVQFMQEEFDRNVALFDIWFDNWRMRVGRQVHDQLEEALQESDYLVLMVSESSLNSKFVELEWKQKFFAPFYDKTKNTDRVLPVYLDTKHKLPDFLRPIFGVPYSGPSDQSNIKKLVDQMLSTHRNSHAASQQ